jgi:hypothetical protein
LKNRLWGVITLSIWLVAGCAIQAPSIKELQIQSETLPSPAQDNVSGNQFCLHVKYSNTYLYLYSENYAEGWVTDGSCSVAGARRAVQTIGLNYRDKDEGLNGKKCLNAESCSFSERNYGIGKTIVCASTIARDGFLSAQVTTDHVSCP